MTDRIELPCVFIFARVGDGTLRFFNTTSIILVLVFASLAFLLSAHSPLEEKRRGRLAMLVPLAILVFWFLFQFLQLFPQFPTVRHLRPADEFVWFTNSILCFAFGVGFCIHLLRTQTRLARLEGVAFLVIYLLLIVFRYRVMPPLVGA